MKMKRLRIIFLAAFIGILLNFWYARWGYYRNNDSRRYNNVNYYRNSNMFNPLWIIRKRQKDARKGMEKFMKKWQKLTKKVKERMLGKGRRKKYIDIATLSIEFKRERKNLRQLGKNVVKSDDYLKTIQQLKEISTKVDTWWVNNDVRNILKNQLDTFDINLTYDPKKVVTFDNLKELYVANLEYYKNMLDCSGTSDYTIKQFCNKIDSLENQLMNKDLNVNVIYKLDLINRNLTKAVLYAWMLMQFKKWNIVLTYDNKWRLTSIDFVRTYDLDPNSVIIPVRWNKVDIKIITGWISNLKLPNNSIAFVLGIRDGKVVWFKIYPTDKDLKIPGATFYKVMIVEGIKKWCSSYQYAISYKNKDIKVYLDKSKVPSWYKWIIINNNEWCYDDFKVLPKEDWKCWQKLNTCEKWVFKDVVDTSIQYRWQCIGKNGGKTVTCSVSKISPVKLFCDVFIKDWFKIKRGIKKWYCETADGYYIIDSSIYSKGCNSSIVANKSRCIVKIGSFYVAPANTQTRKNWYDAVKYCNNLNIWGKSWRLPSYKMGSWLWPSKGELLDIINNLRKIYWFVKGQYKYYWSASRWYACYYNYYKIFGSNAFCASLNYRLGSSKYVRCVTSKNILRRNIIEGVCWYANWKAFNNRPIIWLCSKWKVRRTDYWWSDGTYNWRCEWVNGWRTVDCYARKSLPKVDGRCGTTKNSCMSWIFRDLPDTRSSYRWQCVGKNGGRTVTCSKSMINWSKLTSYSKLYSSSYSKKCPSWYKRMYVSWQWWWCYQDLWYNLEDCTYSSDWRERMIKNLYKKWWRCGDKAGIKFRVDYYKKKGRIQTVKAFEAAYKRWCKRVNVSVWGYRDKRNIKKCLTLLHQKFNNKCKNWEYVLWTHYCKYKK